MSGNEVRKVEKKFAKRWIEVQRIAHKEVTILWDRHDKLKGTGDTQTQQGIIGKIIGIEWVLTLLQELEHKDERDLSV